MPLLPRSPYVLTLHRRFDTDALTPNYCFNNFAGLADGSAYTQDTSVTGAFAWKQPLFDPSTDATRYTYCLNDPLLPGQRDTFCKGGGYKVLFPRKPGLCTQANARAKGYSGFTIGSWGDPAKICSHPASGDQASPFSAALSACNALMHELGVHLLSGQPARIDAAAAHQCGTPCHQRTARWWLNAVQVTPDDPKTGPDRTIIYVVPVSWKVARLIWSYAHTSDLSFYNVNNARVRFCARACTVGGSLGRHRGPSTRRTRQRTMTLPPPGPSRRSSFRRETGPGSGNPSAKSEATPATTKP